MKHNKNQKKVKLNSHVLVPHATSKVHEGKILTVLWFSDREIYTGSSDHSIKIVDVEKLETSSTI